MAFWDWMTKPMLKDRKEAGIQLAEKLDDLSRQEDVVVLGLPRGGVPVAAEIAKALGVTLDVFVVRKLGMPGHEELAMGAIAPGGIVVFNENIVQTTGISEQSIQQVKERELAELDRRSRAYRGDLPFPELTGKKVVLVDDGLATGASMRAAIQAARAADPAEIIVAVPVAPPSTVREISSSVERIEVLHTPDDFRGVGQWYEDFAQTTDEEVRAALGG